MTPNEDCPLCKERFVDCVADVLLEKERIIEFLRSSAKTLEESGPGSWSTASEEDKACVSLLECMAKLIENGSWVDTLAHQKAMRRRATLKIVR